MIESPFSEGFSELIARVNNHIFVRGDSWVITDTGDVKDIVRKGERGYILTESERGGAENFVLTTPSRAILEKFLTCVYGALVRRELGYRAISSVGYTPADLYPKYHLEEVLPGRIAIVDQHGVVPVVAGGDLLTSAGDAVKISWVIDSQLSDVRASYLDRDGLPLFPGLRLDANTSLREG